jgi:hypothetical protein
MACKLSGSEEFALGEGYTIIKRSESNEYES